MHLQTAANNKKGKWTAMRVGRYGNLIFDMKVFRN